MGRAPGGRVRPLGHVDLVPRGRDDLFISRQIEVYADGTVLKYDEFHPADAYGGLGDQPIHVEADGFLPFEIGQAEFEQAWATGVAKNR